MIEYDTECVERGAVVRMTVTMPDELYAAIIEAVKSEGEENVSRWVRDAIRAKLDGEEKA